MSAQIMDAWMRLPTMVPPSATTPSSFPQNSTGASDATRLRPPLNPTLHRAQQPSWPPHKEQKRAQGSVHQRLPPILPLPSHPAGAAPTNPRGGPAGPCDVFFRTRLCEKFQTYGYCRFGDRCCFAHGSEMLRSASDNYQAISRGGGGGVGGRALCKIFQRGQPCPYGDRCCFLHVDAQGPSTAVADGGGRGCGHDGSFGTKRRRLDDVGGVHNFNHKPKARKTNMCHSWEATGRCSYGDACCYAHGYAELNTPAEKCELDHHEDVHMVTSRPPIHADVATGIGTSTQHAQSESKGILKWNDKKKLVGIYGDWI